MKKREILENICFEFTEDADFRNGFFNVLIHNQYLEDLKSRMGAHGYSIASVKKNIFCY